MTLRRIVMDTNTVIMPITRPGQSNDSWIISKWQAKEIIPLTSRETEEELLEKLTEPRFGVPTDQISARAAMYLDYCQRIEIPDPPPVTPECREDPTDQKFLILAYQAKAEAIVSKDGDLLRIKDESVVPILSWQEFVKELFHP